jgi:ribulose-bisphosphate carboxylase large chain
MDASRITATYLIETAHPLNKAVDLMAGEQSAGTFAPVPGETPELLERHGARVERITELDSAAVPSLPGAKFKAAEQPPRFQRAEVVLSFPFENTGASVTTLMSTVAGNLYELGPFSGLRLLDFEIPLAFADVYPGPQFSIAGTRELTGVQGRPLIGTIVKPSVGLSPDDTAALVDTLCAAGLDFVKDDELQTNSPHSPLKARVEAVMRVINRHADTTGKKLMYAFNITGDIDDMLRGHDLILDHGGTCAMVNLVSVGLTGVAYLRKHSQLPIHGHRAGFGMMSRHPLLGMEFTAFQKFFRLAGIDHIHVNGLRSKFTESDESVIKSARACLTPMPGGHRIMPVFSSGQWAGQAPDAYRLLDSVDCIYLAGGGIMAHPDGIAAGAASLREAWEAALQRIPLDVYAQTHPALRGALDKFSDLL